MNDVPAEMRRIRHAICNPRFGNLELDTEIQIAAQHMTNCLRRLMIARVIDFEDVQRIESFDDCLNVIRRASETASAMAEIQRRVEALRDDDSTPDPRGVNDDQETPPRLATRPRSDARADSRGVPGYSSDVE